MSGTTPVVVTSQQLSDEEKKAGKRWVMKNILLLSTAFLCIFNAFQGLSRLQSSLHKTDGMGTTNMSLLYGALVLSCLVVPKPLIRAIGHKWTIPLCFCGYILWMGANGHGSWASMSPASVIVGLAAAPLWTAQCAYFIAMAGKYSSLSGENNDDVVTKFFGIFFFFFQLSSITGSIISTTILEPTVANGTQEEPSDEVLASCGINDCPDNAFSNPNLEDPKDSTVWTMVGVYLAIAFVGLAIAVFLVNQLPEDIDPRNNDDSKVVDLIMGTVKHLRHKYQLILIPLTMYSGFEQSFYGAEFSRSYVGCALGVWEIGKVTIPFGVVNCIVSFTTGRVVKYTGRFPVFTAGLIVDLCIQGVLAFWDPHPDDEYVLYILSAMWGFTDGIWQTQINALYGVLFTNEAEAAFANYRMWESIGFIIAFAYSEHICTEPKLIVITCVLIVGYIGFCIVTVMEKNRKKNEPANIDDLKNGYENRAMDNIDDEDRKKQEQADIDTHNIKAVTL